MDAGDPARCPDPSALRLRVVLNDYVAEVIARAYVLLVFLDRAASAVATGDAGAASDTADEPDNDAAAIAAIEAFFHIYLSPTLCPEHYAALRGVLEDAAAATGGPALLFVACTPGTWDTLRAVLQRWVTHGMTMEAVAAHSKALQHQQKVIKRANEPFEAPEIKVQRATYATVC